MTVPLSSIQANSYNPDIPNLLNTFKYSRLNNGIIAKPSLNFVHRLTDRERLIQEINNRAMKTENPEFNPQLRRARDVNDFINRQGKFLNREKVVTDKLSVDGSVGEIIRTEMDYGDSDEQLRNFIINKLENAKTMTDQAKQDKEFQILQILSAMFLSGDLRKILKMQRDSTDPTRDVAPIDRVALEESLNNSLAPILVTLQQIADKEPVAARIPTLEGIVEDPTKLPSTPPDTGTSSRKGSESTVKKAARSLLGIFSGLTTTDYGQKLNEIVQMVKRDKTNFTKEQKLTINKLDSITNPEVLDVKSKQIIDRMHDDLTYNEYNANDITNSSIDILGSYKVLGFNILVAQKAREYGIEIMGPAPPELVGEFNEQALVAFLVNRNNPVYFVPTSTLKNARKWDVYVGTNINNKNRLEVAEHSSRGNTKNYISLALKDIHNKINTLIFMKFHDVPSGSTLRAISADKELEDIFSRMLMQSIRYELSA